MKWSPEFERNEKDVRLVAMETDNLYGGDNVVLGDSGMACDLFDFSSSSHGNAQKDFEKQ